MDNWNIEPWEPEYMSEFRLFKAWVEETIQKIERLENGLPPDNSFMILLEFEQRKAFLELLLPTGSSHETEKIEQEVRNLRSRLETALELAEARYKAKVESKLKEKELEYRKEQFGVLKRIIAVLERIISFGKT